MPELLDNDMRSHAADTCAFCDGECAHSQSVPFMDARLGSGSWKRLTIPMCGDCYKHAASLLCTVQRPLCGSCADISDGDYVCVTCTRPGPLLVANDAVESVADAICVHAPVLAGNA
jgi:hypothetical protein